MANDQCPIPAGRVRPRSRPRPDARVHRLRRPAQAHVRRRARHAGHGGETRRRRRALGHRGPAPRLRLRALSQSRPRAGSRAPRRRREDPLRPRPAGGGAGGDPGPRRLHRRPPHHSAGEGALRRGRALRLSGSLRAGAPVAESGRSRSAERPEEAQGQGIRARGEPGGRVCGGPRAGPSARRADRLRPRRAPPSREGPRPPPGVTVPPAAARALPPEVVERAMARAAGSRPIPGNRVVLLFDGPEVYPAMLERIAAARKWIPLDNYIIRSDATGLRFADALVERARAGIPVRVQTDWFGSLTTRRRFWRRLRRAGVSVRWFNPPRPLRSEEHTSELQSLAYLVCRLLLEK